MLDMETLNSLKDYKFYRISTDINNKIFLEFKNDWHNSIFLKHSVIKNRGISFYHDMTLYEIFKNASMKEFKKYVIKNY